MAARVLCLVVLMSLTAACRGAVSVQDEQLASDDRFTWPARDRANAFYSGHSLSDGVPEAVARIAAARSQTFNFEVQSLPYSLLRERTKGSPSSTGWDGYKTGNNRSGSGLDVAGELAHPTRLPAGEHYDALVVTERHDLPWAAAAEGTVAYLDDIATRMWQGNPQANVFLYHTWLALDRTAPQPWIRYERRALRLWECVASRANFDIARSGARIRVLPGGKALANLVELLWDDNVPGLPDMTPAARVGLLFKDDVHLSPAGTAYMGLVHYAFLFGQRPAESPLVAPLTQETMTFLEGLAERQASDYARVATAAAGRDMEACRLFAATEMADANLALPARGWREWLQRPYRNWRAARVYGDATAAQNPFGRR